MKKIAFFLSILLFMGISMSNAQTKILTGTVTSSDDGTPIPGVSVAVKGTTLGTVTNIDGEYSLQVPVDARTLVVSFVGMKTLEIPIGSSTTINVVMEPDIFGIDEVVVTAMGISKEKKALGYSVQDISSEEIARANNPNLITTLSGKVAGIEVRQSSGMPGAPATVLIRGARSFSGNNQPLYVVDGMPITSNPDYDQNVTGAYYSSRTLDLDPNDIESINVLKGQAAAALYGLRASNGVIVITTKSGKSTNGNPVVSITSSYTADVISRWPDVQQTYAQGYYEDFYPAFSYSWGPKIADLADDPTYGGNSRGKSGMWFDPYKGQWAQPKAYNNAKGFFDNGSTWYEGVNVSNSTANSSYLIGLSVTDQSGIVPNTGMSRYTAKANATTNLGKFFKAGFSANFSDVDLQKLPSGNSSYLFTVLGAPASFDLMGTPYHMEGPLGQYRQISYRRGGVGENPRWAVENNKFLETTRRFFGNTYLEFTPNDWMKIRYQMGVDSYSTDNEDIYQMGSAGTGQALPTAGNYPTPDNPVFGYRAPTGGAIDNYGVMRSTFNSLLNITFTKQISEDLSGTLLVGNEFNDMVRRSWEMSGTGFSVPGWNNMSNTSTQTADESKGRSRTVGTYANLSLDYKEMLYLNATGRYDVVSSMPRDNRAFFYPSVSLGFIFTQLAGLQDNLVLSFGKIRGSYAQVGQAGTFREQTYVVGGAGSGFLDDGIDFPLGGISGFRPTSTIYDPDLKPQNTKNWEVGMELKFFNNRFGVDYTYSDQVATDQIFTVPMAGSTGYSGFVTNAGEMTSKAHEAIVNIFPVRSKDFDWSINVNFTKVKNKVVSLAEGIESVSLAGYTTPNVRAYAGYTYPTIYGETMARDEQGRILIDDDPDSYYYGYPMSGGSGKIGDVSPDFIVGGSTSFRYKFITLSAQLDWKQGGDIYSGTNRLMALYGSAGFTEDRISEFSYKDTQNAKGVGVLSDGSVNNIVRGGADDIEAYPDFYSDIMGSIDEMNIYETSYLKLREVSLTIDLPKKILTPVKLKGASLSLVGRNFLLWTTLPNVDPETSQGMGNGQMGFEYVSLPQTSSYGVTLNLTF
ncbi:SusC/RagA family TonB-linked outer membrane protein [Maribellus sp. CM-23]|uniref:SusC/RagA family TonB-linked outer membrane protein n=1 Tax=Maribellus sp. CM-23 TaxID=2781026 RepID=UPI001F21375B|nr:SusC/RagA family TonB-linked outer membrane protein [Maribellus sp. CM-23]MCE4565582.1 SusC/RagA family TonB-linked outer membrane protein [Maribellus sp. CM-23]